MGAIEMVSWEPIHFDRNSENRLNIVSRKKENFLNSIGQCREVSSEKDNDKETCGKALGDSERYPNFFRLCSYLHIQLFF